MTLKKLAASCVCFLMGFTAVEVFGSVPITGNKAFTHIPAISAVTAAPGKSIVAQDTADFLLARRGPDLRNNSLRAKRPATREIQKNKPWKNSYSGQAYRLRQNSNRNRTPLTPSGKPAGSNNRKLKNIKKLRAPR